VPQGEKRLRKRDRNDRLRKRRQKKEGKWERIPVRTQENVIKRKENEAPHHREGEREGGLSITEFQKEGKKSILGESV